jgi:hypothetical protein
MCMNLWYIILEVRSPVCAEDHILDAFPPFPPPFGAPLPPPALASQDLVVSSIGPRVIGLPPPFTILARKRAASLALLSAPYER